MATTATTIRSRTSGHIAAGILLVCSTVASVGGLLVDGFYTDGPWARAALRGNDLVIAVLSAGAAALMLRALHWDVGGVGTKVLRCPGSSRLAGRRTEDLRPASSGPSHLLARGSGGRR